MELLQDGLIAFFSAVGVAGCIWLVAGALLGSGKCRNGEALLVLPVHGTAPAMEQDLRDLVRIRREIPGAQIVLADCGLTEDARALAQYFCQRYDGVTLETGAPYDTTGTPASISR